MSEGHKAKALAQCKSGTCRLTSDITETSKPMQPIEYSGTISCGVCGNDWAYSRTEGEAPKIELLGFRMAL